MEQLDVLNPLGIKQNHNVKTNSKLNCLEGKKIAFLDNLKPQSDQVLNGIIDKFGQWGMECGLFRKMDTPTPVPGSVAQEIRQKYHAMVTGVGD